MFFLCVLVPALLFGQRSIRSYRLEVTGAWDAAPDSAALSVLMRYKAVADSVLSPIVCFSQVAMTSGRPESLLGNWVADAIVENSGFAEGECADLGIVNVGSMRGSVPKGEVRRGDIMFVIPFQDYLAMAYIKGKDLLSLFREIAATGGEAVSKEVRMLITKDGGLKDVTVCGQPIDEGRTYRVVTLDYLAEGNDQMPSFAKAQRVEIGGACIRYILTESVRRKGIITAAMEGRIRVEE